MPTISPFQGIDILMRLNEHRPPHFHAKYGEHIAAIGIGKWGKLHEAELRENGRRGERGELPNKIQGL